MKLKGYIDYKSGHTDKATEYRILDIEGFSQKIDFKTWWYKIEH